MGTEDSEEALMQAYASGEAQAFRTLFSALAPRVHAFFVRSFRDRSVADDLMQSTFLKLHGARGQYQAGRPLRPWLFTIAASVRKDELRRRYRLREDASEDAIERAEASGAEIRPDAESDPSDDVEALRRALETLPESQRVVLHLHRFEELTFEQIAEALGTSPGAVRVRASRAYDALRTRMREGRAKAGAA
jgi:RNA polymerase sigma-70 factor (ECF subfamily)